MRKNFRLSETEARDIEVIKFLEDARNESELIKNALIFYKKAIEKNVIFDTNINNEEMWNKIFETAVPLKLIKEDREKVKEKLLKQKKKEEKEKLKELIAVSINKTNKENNTELHLENKEEANTKNKTNDNEPLSFNDIIDNSGDM